MCGRVDEDVVENSALWLGGEDVSYVCIVQ